MNSVYSQKKTKNIDFGIMHFKDNMDDLKYRMCSPYKYITEGGIKSTKTFNDKDFILEDFSHLLKDSFWLDYDISEYGTKKFKGLLKNPLSNDVFFLKYGNIPQNSDTRYGVSDWQSELRRALDHLPTRNLSGNLLHMGCDTYYEPQLLHQKAKSISIADISHGLLEKAKRTIKNANTIQTRAEKLYGIANNSIDFYVALRVYSSYNLNKFESINQATRVLKHGGSILLSISNGYLANDDTIIPGQIIGSPARLDYAKPYDNACQILSFLSGVGFRELFLVPGSSELFLGGTFYPKNLNHTDKPTFHIEDCNTIPICFYSEHMPTSWLGNYSQTPIMVDGEKWNTVEHYFQAQKFDSTTYQNKIKSIPNPDGAKKFAWSIQSFEKKNWSDIKINIMKKGVEAKFKQYKNLSSSLRKTQNRELIERTNKDYFWGKSLSGTGLNKMGEILMELRDTYKRN